jgi:bifunctional non-homologous end joining protein LigD
LRTVTRAPRAPHPTFVQPIAADAVDKLPEGGEWMYEVKFDGYRALVLKNGPSVQIRLRNDEDLTSTYSSVAASGRRLRADRAVLGEMVAVDLR